MSFKRILTNICSDRLAESRDFYVALLGFKVNYDSDWYVQLCSPSNPELEFGIILRTHDLVPQAYQTAPSGMYVTFVVPDVDQVYQTAVSMGCHIVQAPKNEFYGQRRFLTVDPNGCLVDICSPWSEADPRFGVGP
jgi:catechol 2,3-dioxygenase-like lactoylglutathione lyase family enzyme